jgi:hypothetical protein
MSATYGELLDTSRLHLARARARAHTGGLDAPAATLSAVDHLAHLARTADDHVTTILGRHRLELSTLLHRRVDKHHTSVLPTEAAHMSAIRELLPEPHEASEPMGRVATALHASRQALGAATDLLRTHDDAPGWTPAPPVGLGQYDGSALQGLRVLWQVSVLASRMRIDVHRHFRDEPEHRVHRDIENLEALGEKSLAFARHLSAKPVIDLSSVRTARPTIDVTSSATQLRDHVARMAARARELLRAGDISVHTAKDLYGTVGALHWGSGCSPDVNPYIEVANELATYQSVIPPDPQIRADAKAVLGLLRPGMRDPQYAHQMHAACRESATPLGEVLNELTGTGKVDAWRVQGRTYSSVIKQWGPYIERVELTPQAPIVVAL